MLATRAARAGSAALAAGRHGLRRLRGEVLSVVLQGLMVLGLLGGSFALCRQYVLQSICVEGASMVPTLRERHWYLASPLWLRWQGIQRGDIVVLRDPTDQTPVVKRVIAVEGDTVELRGGRVFLNGRLLEEPYLPEGTRTDPIQRRWARVTCGPGEVYVLGDNRGVSADSREYGPVRSEAVVGRVLW
ncbi:signal peptidase I [Limisphaera sp. 4302-co]|uniref:signal peptidase I n=1 Tax=Limisphaera sp. 4302-co TaxID=3400417 RepID=UPI003C22E454